MNIILFDKSELQTNNRLTLTDHRHKHICSVLKSANGDKLNVGVIDGDIGQGVIFSSNKDQTILDINLNSEPPAPLALKLALAMPRPKVLKRVIYNAITMGVKEFHIFNSWRVEKSFWKSPIVEEGALHKQIHEGLEQAKDTILPTIKFHRFFNDFIKKDLKDISDNTQKLIAHPYNNADTIIQCQHPTTLIVGPEGGFIDREIESFKNIDFQTIQIGSRVLKVETAVTSLIAKLYL